jgi:hypothetical protein
MARIEDYALIGDCETAAWWACLPRFDADSCFAKLLGSHDNGYWRVAPVASRSLERRYRPGTLILETSFKTDEGSSCHGFHAAQIRRIPHRAEGRVGKTKKLGLITVRQCSLTGYRRRLVTCSGPYRNPLTWRSRFVHGFSSEILQRRLHARERLFRVSF